MALALAASAVAAQATAPEHIARIEAGQAQARQQCERLIHFDTTEFDPCIDELARRAAATPYAQLGVLYGGWVSAMNYAHGGLPGARQSAWRLLKRFSDLQTRLQVDPYVLCATVPGNCRNRVPRTEAMLRAGPPPQGSIPKNHRHDH